MLRSIPRDRSGVEGGTPIAEAAQRLGMSVEAVRRCIRRGTLAGHKDASGEWWVILPADDTAAVAAASSPRIARVAAPALRRSSALDALAEQLAARDRRIHELETERDVLLAEREEWRAKQADLARRLGHIEGRLTAEREQTAVQLAERDRRIQELESERAELYQTRGRLLAELEHARAQFASLSTAADEAAAQRRRWWAFWGR